jgi:hypothetical protein
MPPGDEVTSPLPATVTETDGGPLAAVLNVACALAAAFIVTTQAPVPVHAPVQPANVDPDAGDGVSVTAVPLAKVVLHVGAQLMPAGELATVPVPVPASVTVNVCGGGGVLERNDAEPKYAVTASELLTVSEQVPVPVHAPLQPLKGVAALPVAVNTTAAPAA